MGEARRRRLAGTYPTQAPTSETVPKSLLPTTPGHPLSRSVRELCARVSPGADPVFLSYTDVGAGYRAGQCHVNVYHRVREHGGQRVNGWLVWESVMFSECEFHCVWQSPDGDLIDITPRRDREVTILFLPDPTTRLERSLRGMWQPTNRLSIGGYSMMGLPYPQPVAENALSAVTRDYCVSLGVEPFAVCRLPHNPEERG